jgi:hypothetical protein
MGMMWQYYYYSSETMHTPIQHIIPRLTVARGNEFECGSRVSFFLFTWAYAPWFDTLNN